jgi:hypothetical protein
MAEEPAVRGGIEIGERLQHPPRLDLGVLDFGDAGHHQLGVLDGVMGGAIKE